MSGNKLPVRPCESDEAAKIAKELLCLMDNGKAELVAVFEAARCLRTLERKHFAGVTHEQEQAAREKLDAAIMAVERSIVAAGRGRTCKS